MNSSDKDVVPQLKRQRKICIRTLPAIHISGDEEYMKYIEELLTDNELPKKKNNVKPQYPQNNK